MSIYAGALFIQLALGWDMYLSIVGLLIITGVYTILGKRDFIFLIFSHCILIKDFDPVLFTSSRRDTGAKYHKTTKIWLGLLKIFNILCAVNCWALRIFATKIFILCTPVGN